MKEIRGLLNPMSSDRITVLGNVLRQIDAPIELRGSYPTEVDEKDKEAPPQSFIEWYAEIVSKYHPINNRIYELEI